MKGITRYWGTCLQDKLESSFIDVSIQEISYILNSFDPLTVQSSNEGNIFVRWVDTSVKIEKNMKMAKLMYLSYLQHRS